MPFRALDRPRLGVFCLELDDDLDLIEDLELALPLELREELRDRGFSFLVFLSFPVPLLVLGAALAVCKS